MRRIAFSLLVVCASRAWAQAPELSLSSTFEWPGRLDVCGSLAAGDGVVGFTCADTIDGWRFTLDFPWIAVGPLAPKGVLREEENPLGFSPRSNVFRERTGLGTDLDHTDRQAGFLCMPVPETIGLFYAPGAAGGILLGCFSSVPVHAGANLEGAASLARPDGKSFGDSWTGESAPFPGGALLNTAGRLVVDAPPFGLSAAAGCSLGERISPGAFFHLWLAGMSDGIDASLLLGHADRLYRTPSGSTSGDAWQVAGTVSLSSGASTLALEVSRAASQAGFAPHPFIATTQSAGFRLTQIFDVAKEGRITIREEAGKRIRMDADGIRGEQVRWGLIVQAEAGEASASAGWSWSDTSGAVVSLTLSAAVSKSLRFGIEARAKPLDGGGVSLSATGALRATREDATFSIKAGCGEGENLSLALSWTARTRKGHEAGSAP